MCDADIEWFHHSHPGLRELRLLAGLDRLQDVDKMAYCTVLGLQAGAFSAQITGKKCPGWVFFLVVLPIFMTRSTLSSAVLNIIIFVAFVMGKPIFRYLFGCDVAC